MERLSKPISLLLCTALSVLLPVSVEAVESNYIPQEYTAVYEVFRNDKSLAEITIRLSQQDDIWTLHGFTHDMQGLADVLNVKGVQTVTGRWQDDRFLPENYDFSFSLVGYKTTWHANFDWPTAMVTTRSKSGETQLPLSNGAVDPFSLSLNVRSYLSRDQSRMVVEVVDEDEIENHVYEADLEESVETTLGCLQTTRVRRVRENSKRTSLVWYAKDYHYVPVQMLHHKKKGKGLRLQIISLNIAGQPIQPTASCENNDPELLQASLD